MIAIETDAVRPILEQIAEGKARYLCQFHVQVGWPQWVVHGESHYFQDWQGRSPAQRWMSHG